jgi:plasmid replication initiation protein
MYEIAEQMSMDLDRNNLVVQSNMLIYGNYDMTAMEQKLVLILISTIKKTDKNTNTVEFQVKDLAEVLEVTPELLYRDLQKICTSIMKRIVEIKKDNGNWELFNIISYAQYKKKEGKIVLEINKKAEPYLLQLKDLFTSFRLSNALDLSGKYAIRIYQLTKGCLFKGQLLYDVEDFKKALKIDKKKTYESFAKISEKILNPSLEEINSKSDISVSYETIRESRKIKTIKFTIKSKANKKVSLSKSTITNKKVSFNNFEAREMYSDKEQMKSLEEKLLGWDKDDEVAIDVESK